MNISTSLRPPGPGFKWLGFANLIALKRDYLGFVSSLQKVYGDITYMRILNEQAFDLLCPDLVREALIDNAEHLIRWERGIEVFEQIFGKSVLVTEGEVWKRQRRMLMPAFTPKRVAGYANLMRGAATAALNAAVPHGEGDALVSMDALFSGLTMDVILRTLFGHVVTEREANLASAATTTLGEVAMREMFRPLTLPDWLPLPGKAAKRQALRTLRTLVSKHISQHRENATSQGDDLLSRLLSLRDEDTGSVLSETEVFDQCIVSFQAGHETSATALLWWSRLLAENPDVEQRIREELDQVLGGRDPQPEDLPFLVFLGASLKEAMRLYPPIAAVMTRRTTREIKLGGWHVPRGSLLRITPWVLHRDPRWYQEPDTFKPERFLTDAPQHPRGAWMPFGTGPRVCIGQHFATLEMTLIGAMLLQRYRLALPPDAPKYCEPVLNVTLRPRGGVKLQLTRMQVFATKLDQ